MELSWGLSNSCLLLSWSSMLRHGSAVKKYSSFHSCIYFFYSHPLPLLIRVPCALLHDMNWWPTSYMLHWSFHWPVSTELAEKSQGEARLTTLLWDLQGMHGSCKEWQCGTEGEGWSPVKLSGQGREAQDEATLSCILTLLAAHHSGTETLYDGYTENFVEGSTDDMVPLVKSRKLFDRC